MPEDGFMSNRCSLIIILCEDRQQDSFIRRFLKKAHGLQPHSIRTVINPAGKGSGEQFVRKEYPHQLQSIRQRHANTILIVATDADISETTTIINKLNNACTKSEIEPATDIDNVVFVIPKRNIETWISFLNGNSVNEDSVYGKLPYESECQPAVNTLHNMCKSGNTPDDFPESLIATCREYRKVKYHLS